MTENTISTTSRFIYLNTYAFLLIFMGIGIVLIPLYKISPWFLAAQVIGLLICEKNGIGILRSWKDKKRKYRILMERNAAGIRPDSFSEYMQAPCGRLLVKVVLEDLGKKEEYASLLRLREPFMDRLKAGCRPAKTTIYVRGKKL